MEWEGESRASRPQISLERGGERGEQVNMKQNCTSSEAVASITLTESCWSSVGE